MEDTTQPKPGIKSTEFWVTVIVGILGQIMSAYGLYKGSEPIAGIGAIVTAMAAGTYTHSRGQAKRAKA